MLNLERVSPPDFDIDFCMRRREDVINFVRDKYGEDSVNAELKQAGFRDLFLHAAGLSMQIDGAQLRIACDPPSFWQRFEEQYGEAE